MLLLAATLWLVHPYFEPCLIGTSDALWYHHSLADTVTQFRAGVFPVYVGQSDFSFNGSIYPIRIAPYHQYFAGAIDLATRHTLGFFALQHLTMILSVLGGAFSAYGSLAWIAPARRWTALTLALLYVMCPGVVGLFYAQDLYMSGMTLPWVPLALAALVKSFDEDRWFPFGVLGASLAALWWAHSPIALWTTSVAFIAQAVRIVTGWPSRPRPAAIAVAVGVFCVLSVYPFASVFLLRSPGEAIVPYIMDRDLLLKWVAQSFPASVLPLDPASPNISYMQLGYGLWIILVAGIVGWMSGTRRPAPGILLASAAFFLVLVFPVPGLTRALWLSFPEAVVGMTLYWPMQRFYIIVAAIAIVCFQRVLADSRPWRPVASAAGFGLLLAAVTWSASEDSKLIRQASLQEDSIEGSLLYSLPENVAIQRHSYGLFADRPSYFSHGVMAPRLQSRLLDPATGMIVASNFDQAARVQPQEEFHGTIDANPGILDLNPPLNFKPGVQYLLTFAFAHPETTGLLQMIGNRFYREYTLPSSGDSKSFGSGPGNQKCIAVWTTGPGEETVNLRFIPTGRGAKPADYMPFARFRLQPIDEAALPVRLESLIPYRAMVHSPQAAMLETPRMFIPGYEAAVNGSPVPVRKSAEGLVAFPVPRGESRVELRFTGPLLLRAAFWLNAAGWLAAAAWALSHLLCSFRRGRA
jgi:hypothetical protein